jgi:hypothetical protein
MTKEWEIEKYTLSFKPTKTGEVSFLLKPSDINKAKAILYPHRLLYIVTFQNEYLYVGEAKAELKTRFQRSFTRYRHYKRTGDARGGYKGYKWIELIDNDNSIQLDVWTVLLPSSYNNNRDKVEAIEGEVVWEIRNRQKKWPTYQNEIHFNNNYSRASEDAIKILRMINLDFLSGYVLPKN